MLRRSPGRDALIFVGKGLRRGDDLLESLNGLLQREGGRLGRVEAPGAAERARAGYCDPVFFEYRYRDLETDLGTPALPSVEAVDPCLPKCTTTSWGGTGEPLSAGACRIDRGPKPGGNR